MIISNKVVAALGYNLYIHVDYPDKADDFKSGYYKL
jgi:hypothetical protein